MQFLLNIGQPPIGLEYQIHLMDSLYLKNETAFRAGPRILHEPRGQGSEPVHLSTWETPPLRFFFSSISFLLASLIYNISKEMSTVFFNKKYIFYEKYIKNKIKLTSEQESYNMVISNSGMAAILAGSVCADLASGG